MQRPIIRPRALAGFAGGLVLFALNWYIAGKLATVEYLNDMHSIGGAYIGLARYAMRNWPDLTWFPLWSAGVPYQNTYPPLLHLVVAATAQLTGISPALSFHAVTTLLYCLGPVTLAWLASRWSGSPGCGFFAGLLYSLVSPSAWLIRNVREDLGGPFGRAEANGRRLRVGGDKIGLMVVEPECEGRCTVDVTYDGGAEMKAARAASFTGLAACLLWSGLSAYRRRRASCV